MISGNIIIIAGFGLIALSIALFIIGIIYKSTAGRNIRTMLKNEYD